MSGESDKESMWRSRVTAWRASGKTAAAFADGKGFTAGRLLWWQDTDCFKFGGYTSGGIPELMVINAAVAKTTIEEVP